jgi:hypothetical protein
MFTNNEFICTGSQIAFLTAYAPCQWYEQKQMNECDKFLPPRHLWGLVIAFTSCGQGSYPPRCIDMPMITLFCIYHMRYQYTKTASHVRL